MNLIYIILISTLTYLAVLLDPEVPRDGLLPNNCTETELCSCIAAGGCIVSPGSSCRILFCDGEIQNEPFNSKPGNITTIQQPCPELEEN